MSADNAIGIKQFGDKWRVKMIFLSEEEHDFSDAKEYPTYDDAWEAAWDKCESEAIVEYGVMNLDAEPLRYDDLLLPPDEETDTPDGYLPYRIIRDHHNLPDVAWIKIGGFGEGWSLLSEIERFRKD